MSKPTESMQYDIIGINKINVFLSIIHQTYFHL